MNIRIFCKGGTDPTTRHSARFPFTPNSDQLVRESYRKILQEIYDSLHVSIKAKR